MNWRSKPAAGCRELKEIQYRQLCPSSFGSASLSTGASCHRSLSSRLSRWHRGPIRRSSIQAESWSTRAENDANRQPLRPGPRLSYNSGPLRLPGDVAKLSETFCSLVIMYEFVCSPAAFGCKRCLWLSCYFNLFFLAAVELKRKSFGLKKKRFRMRMLWP